LGGNGAHSSIHAPLSMIIFLNNPFAIGETPNMQTIEPPEDSPAIVILSISPPKFPIIFLINLIPAITSPRPFKAPVPLSS